MKVIHSSHLSLRFYKTSWAKEEIEPYLLRGRIIDQGEGQEVRDYFWLDHGQGSQLDMRRLYEEIRPQVFTWRWDGDKYREVVGEEAVAYMQKMNW